MYLKHPYFVVYSLTLLCLYSYLLLSVIIIIDVEEEEQGNDWLYTVIADIILAHNATIDSVYSVIQTQKLKIQTHLMPDEPSLIYLDEVDETTCIIGELTE